jgi:reactive intermediate/imine deaminase
MSSTRIDSDIAPAPLGPYPHARRVGNLLFLSGIGPRLRGARTPPGVTLADDGRVTQYDIEIQCRSVFDNVRNVLASAGAHWGQLIDITVFLTDLERDFAVYNRVYAEQFPDPAHQPCRTTVGVARLPGPIAVELKCIAALDIPTPDP